MKPEEIVINYGGYLVRLLNTIKGFKLKYNKWPTSIKLDNEALEVIKGHHLTKNGYDILNLKVKLIVIKEVKLIAEDEYGNKYHYGVEPIPNDTTSIVRPDLWLWKTDVYPDI